jgi:hypothetical protein
MMESIRRIVAHFIKVSTRLRMDVKPLYQSFKTVAKIYGGENREFSHIEDE